MILPIGHEQGGVRRLPWVSFAVMALCFVAFLAVNPSPSTDGVDDLESALDYFFDHPYLQLDPALLQAIGESGHGGASFLEAARESMPTPADPAQVASEQERLDELTERALGALGVGAFSRWGLVPDDPSPLAFLTHIFMHAGWLHLIGNLLIFYLAAPFIEDVWGRPVFAAFFVVGGLFAATAHVVTHPDSTVPMVGASGAVAAVMGAFLVRYWHTKIKFFYMFGIIVRGTFDAPAWVMLPLWFSVQVFFGLLTTSLGAGAGGVAHWAHVGGFLFGVGVAWAMKHFDVEGRHLQSAIDTKIHETLVDNLEIEQALEAHARGESEHARATLEALVGREPDNEDAVLAYWSLATELGRPEQAAASMGRLVEFELRAGKAELALAHWTELNVRVANPPVGPELLVRVGQQLTREGRRDEAAVALRRAMLLAGSGMAAPLAMRIARTARELDPTVAQGAARLVLSRPDVDPGDRAYAERVLADLSRSRPSRPA